ncbi:hypothetical protein GGR58DRAFT_499075 [Xylaria digitata]|nr:hypothetical protein GGR58DRAFT_499075 [Xylaria digitata]
MSALLRLPAELTALIVYQLESEALFNLRQTCRQANDITINHFAKNHFSQRFIMLERRSLETFRELSRHSVLGPSVSELKIGTDRFLDSHELNVRGFEDNQRLAGYREHQRDTPAYHRAFENQSYLQQSGLDTTYLTSAFEHLSGCEVITLGSYVRHDRPWGVKHLIRQIGVPPNRLIHSWVPSNIKYINRAIQILLEAVMASKMALKELRIVFGFHGIAGDGVTSEMFTLPEPCAVRIRKDLTSLVCLRLVLGTDRSPHWASHLIRFVNLFPSLSHLELHFEPPDEGQSGKNRFQQVCDVLYVPNLQLLEIAYVDCTELDLANLTLRHKDTLKEVVLDCVWLPGEDSWRSVVCTMRDMLALEYLRLDYCGANDNQIVFRGADRNTFEVADPNGYDRLLESIVIPS